MQGCAQLTLIITVRGFSLISSDSESVILNSTRHITNNLYRDFIAIPIGVSHFYT